MNSAALNSQIRAELERTADDLRSIAHVIEDAWKACPSELKLRKAYLDLRAHASKLSIILDLPLMPKLELRPDEDPQKYWLKISQTIDDSSTGGMA